MRRLMILSLLFTCSAYAAVYRWVDNKGQTHYSDIPQAGAVPVDMGASPVAASSPAAAAPAAAHDKEKPVEKPRIYQALTITQPQAEANLRDGAGQLTVGVNSTPPLQSGDQFIILLDGKAAGKAVGNSITVSNIERGAHQLQAQVIGPDGQVLLSSAAITFYMQRPMVKH